MIVSKAEKYYSITQYAYALNNPIIFIDPDGNEVVAMNGKAQQMILNTLPKNTHSFIKFDKSGHLNNNLLNKANTKSGNLAALKQLANDDKTFDVNVANKFTYKDGNGNLKDYNFGSIYNDGEKVEGGMYPNTGEEGFYGITQTPGIKKNKFNSPDNSIKIVVNGELTKEGQAQTFSHEAYGHGVLYSQGKEHKHNAIKTEGGVFKETNADLKTLIIQAILETIKNMKDE